MSRSTEIVKQISSLTNQDNPDNTKKNLAVHGDMKIDQRPNQDKEKK